LLAGAPADAKLDLPFAMCAARSQSQVVGWWCSTRAT
jgi:hypothetical protein